MAIGIGGDKGRAEIHLHGFLENVQPALLPVGEGRLDRSGIFDRVRIVVAWCELREGFRHFRADRIGKVQILDKRYPRRRQALLKEWRASEGIAES